MDVIYTDKNRLEIGSLANFDIDFDTTSSMDFEIKMDIKDGTLAGGYWWYITGTEYGGRVDKVIVDTEKNEVTYSGRNFRGILTSKIIEPPSGEDYLMLSGTISDITENLLERVHMSDIYKVASNEAIAVQYKFFRYVTVYDGIRSLAKSLGLVVVMTVAEDGKVEISFATPTDYSDENEYTQDDMYFTVTREYAEVNHLICLGKGDLAERTVVHLYADKNGNISTKQTLFGADEVTQTYENTQAEDAAELQADGITKLKELITPDSFEVTVPDISLRIGDIIGGVERITDTYITSEITNAIVTIDDTSLYTEYKAGKDDTSSDTEQAGIMTGIKYSLGIDGDSNLYVFSTDGATVPTFEYDSSTGNLYVTGDDTYEYDDETGNLYIVKE